MKIKDMMTEQVETLKPEATLHEAAEAMRELDLGAICVVEDGAVVGIVTDRDIAVRAVARGRTPDQTKVAEIMSRDVVCCREDDTVKDAERLMEEYQIRRLVVLDRRKNLVGIVSVGDIAALDPKMTGRILGKVTQPAPPRGAHPGR